MSCSDPLFLSSPCSGKKLYHRRRRVSDLRFRTWSGIDALNTCLVHDLYLQVVSDPDLAGKSCAFVKVGLGGEYCCLGLADGARIAVQHFDTAGSAACVSAATVKNVDVVVLD